jgi:hypothetical protein
MRTRIVKASVIASRGLVGLDADFAVIGGRVDRSRSGFVVGDADVRLSEFGARVNDVGGTRKMDRHVPAMGAGDDQSGIISEEETNLSLRGLGPDPVTHESLCGDIAVVRLRVHHRCARDGEPEVSAAVAEPRFPALRTHSQNAVV